MDEADLKLVNPDPDAKPLTDTATAEVVALAQRQVNAGGVLLKVISFAGNQVEDGIKFLPKSARSQLEDTARRALERSYEAAARTREGGRLQSDRAHRALATFSGAIGGLGGLPTALAELPVATTVIFRAVQTVAEQYGEDPSDPKTRVECLRVFGSGGPGEADDGVDTTFIGARVGLTGPALNSLLNTIAPRFAAVVGQKLASQAVPILGAAAGASTNYAFVDYYVEMAHVHFGLRRLVRTHGQKAVLERFHSELDQSRRPIRKG